MTEEILTPDTGTGEGSGSGKVFNSAIFADLNAVHGTGKTEGETVSADSSAKPLEEPIILTEEDIQGLIEAPFDFLAWRTKFPAWKLTEDQTHRLCKLWLKPISKLAVKTKNFDIILAAITSFEIVMEKIGDYSIEHHNRTRNEREGKDQLLEEQIA